MSDDRPPSAFDRSLDAVAAVGEWLFRSIEVMIVTAAVSVAAHRVADLTYARAATGVRWAALVFITVSFRKMVVATGVRDAVGLHPRQRPAWLILPAMAIIGLGLYHLDGAFQAGIGTLIGTKPE